MRGDATACMPARSSRARRTAFNRGRQRNQGRGRLGDGYQNARGRHLFVIPRGFTVKNDLGGHSADTVERPLGVRPAVGGAELRLPLHRDRQGESAARAFARKAEPTPYEVLGVGVGASYAELRRAHRRLLRETHPDTGGSAVRFYAVHCAWQLIGDPADRAAYDLRHGDLAGGVPRESEMADLPSCAMPGLTSLPVRASEGENTNV
jgi:hypothetical protein